MSMGGTVFQEKKHSNIDLDDFAIITINVEIWQATASFWDFTKAMFIKDCFEQRKLRKVSSNFHNDIGKKKRQFARS